MAKAVKETGLGHLAYPQRVRISCTFFADFLHISCGSLADLLHVLCIACQVPGRRTQ
jgi:hypothetical protein